MKPFRFITPHVELLDYRRRVDILVSWLTDPVNPVNLAMLYIDNPDVASHSNGPTSNEARDIIEILDNVTATLLEKLEEADLMADTDILFLSDHGQVPYPQMTVNLLEYGVSAEMFESYSPLGDTSNQLYPKKGKNIKFLFLNNWIFNLTQLFALNS